MAVSIARAYNAVEVDLWGARFETVDAPRSSVLKANKLEQEILELEGADASDTEILDKLVAKIGELTDIKLTRIDNGTGKPSTLIKRKWKADDLTLGALLGFLDTVRRAEGEANRPS